MNNTINSTALCAISLLSLASCGQEEAKQEKPNIVMLFVDDWGWADMGCRTEMYKTPNIDKLMGESLNYTRAYVSTATSSPSRASLITGKEALRCGFTRHITHKEVEEQEFETWPTDPGHMFSRGWLLPEEITYAERLKEAGYYNFFIGKWHLGEGKNGEYFPTSQGFDQMYGTCAAGAPSNYAKAPFFKQYNPLPEAKEGEYLTDILTKGAVKFIDNYDKKEPFLLNFWYYSVHEPHTPRKDVLDKYLAMGYEMKDAKYAAMVELLDNSIGEIRTALERNGLTENTLLVLTSDQGGSHKNGHLRGGKKGGDTLAEGGTRVPFAIYAPWSNMMGKEYTQPVSTMDIFPTFVETATGTKCTDKQIQGISLLPTLNGETLPERDIFLHRSYEDQNSAIIRGDWKLIRYRSGKVQLYNIPQDESETTNLAESEPERTKEMLETVVAWQKEATPSYLIQDVPVGCHE